MKLLILLLINVIALISPDMQTEWICVGVIILSLVCIGAYKQALWVLVKRNFLRTGKRAK